MLHHDLIPLHQTSSDTSTLHQVPTTRKPWTALVILAPVPAHLPLRENSGLFLSILSPASHLFLRSYCPNSFSLIPPILQPSLTLFKNESSPQLYYCLPFFPDLLFYL